MDRLKVGALRNPTDRGQRFRRIAGSIPTIAGSPVKG
jgi:hypothetical protein